MNSIEPVFEIAKKIKEEIELIHGSIWTARNDLLKTLISLSSASLILTVTFSGKYIENTNNIVCPWVLFLSWVLFSSSILFAVFGLWKSIMLKSLPASILHAYSKNESSSLENIEDVTGLEKKIKLLIEKATNKIKSAEDWSRFFLGISLICFVLGIICLAAFGWKQY